MRARMATMIPLTTTEASGGREREGRAQDPLCVSVGERCPLPLPPSVSLTLVLASLVWFGLVWFGLVSRFE